MTATNAPPTHAVYPWDVSTLGSTATTATNAPPTNAVNPRGVTTFQLEAAISRRLLIRRMLDQALLDTDDRLIAHYSG